MSNPPNHFFKFIPPGFKFNLSLPRSFWTSLNEWTCKKVVLKRGRHEWPVAINDKGVFGDGWRKLVIDNGVQEFDFIVFKHQGNMLFDFMVFDQSTCERQYPNLLDEIDVEDHIHERLKKSQKRKRNDYSCRKEDKSHLSGDSCFTAIMTPFNIESSRLQFPIKFARSNGFITEDTQKEIVHTKAVIVDEAQRTWPATLQTSRKQVRLGGWRELKIKYHLKAGDSCMFELVKHGELSIFNFYKLGKKPVRDDHIQVQKETSLTSTEETNMTTNNHSYFISTLKPCTFRSSCLYFPVSFSIPNGLKTGEMILRNDKGRSWTIQLRKMGERRFYLGCGLKDFCNANGLKVGDAYKFELIENEKNKPPVANFSLNVDRTMDAEEPIKGSDSIYKLTSFDALDVEEPLTGSDSNYTDQMTKNLKKRKRRDCASQSKHEFQFQLGKDRSFMTVMTPYYIRSSILHVPVKFARSNGLITKRSQTQIVNKQIVIIDEAQRTWPATLKIRSNQVRIMCWRKLQVKHKLKVGDACMFELLKLGEVPVFNFYRKTPTENNSQAEVEIDSTIKKETRLTLKRKTGLVTPMTPKSYDLARRKKNYPYFISEVKSYVKKKMLLYLPKKFARKNGLFNKEEIILKNVRNEGSWTVELKSSKNNKYCYIRRGWKEFYVANGLKDGDLFKFELVDNGEKPTANFRFQSIS
ncbi:auxin response factor [Artemisia annua]|uniref:Auxin response factor n=1 Tax=Artemisia annua TaxID=35608 RepID=A0A2U1NTP6_ARTAN|nr:auxin response factor [Artemisia annua]